jgi:hypothetical protein
LFGFSLQGLPLVVHPLAPGQTQLHLGFTIFEVDLQWNQSKSLLLGLALQSFDLPILYKEFTDTIRFVVVMIGMAVRADVALHEIKLAGLYASVTVLEVGTSLAQGLDFGTQQNHTCLNDFEDLVVISGLLVLTYDLDVRLLH